MEKLKLVVSGENDYKSRFEIQNKTKQNKTKQTKTNNRSLLRIRISNNSHLIKHQTRSYYMKSVVTAVVGHHLRHVSRLRSSSSRRIVTFHSIYKNNNNNNNNLINNRRYLFTSSSTSSATSSSSHLNNNNNNNNKTRRFGVGTAVTAATALTSIALLAANGYSTTATAIHNKAQIVINNLPSLLLPSIGMSREVKAKEPQEALEKVESAPWWKWVPTTDALLKAAEQKMLAGEMTSRDSS